MLRREKAKKSFRFYLNVAAPMHWKKRRMSNDEAESLTISSKAFSAPTITSASFNMAASPSASVAATSMVQNKSIDLSRRERIHEPMNAGSRLPSSSMAAHSTAPTLTSHSSTKTSAGISSPAGAGVHLVQRPRNAQETFPTLSSGSSGPKRPPPPLKPIAVTTQSGPSSDDGPSAFHRPSQPSHDTSTDNPLSKGLSGLPGKMFDNWRSPPRNPRQQPAPADRRKRQMDSKVPPPSGPFDPQIPMLYHTVLNFDFGRYLPPNGPYPPATVGSAEMAQRRHPPPQTIHSMQEQNQFLQQWGGPMFPPMPPQTLPEPNRSPFQRPNLAKRNGHPSRSQPSENDRRKQDFETLIANPTWQSLAKPTGRSATTTGRNAQRNPQEVSPISSHRCCRCKKAAEFLCTGCSQTWYCTEDCQVQDWESHRLICLNRTPIAQPSVMQPLPIPSSSGQSIQPHPQSISTSRLRPVKPKPIVPRSSTRKKLGLSDL
ncbi:unnamed protein product [Cyprideis torosa]|uniref:Uncharacterized protein n=1 Tax=Cyprideis torosa TaxID=163714 RepID=A0A7R8WIV7_9CRUS|nr:unnamed protein product [Cyprideis torosa]CAG0894938.1 unnamed protein product [Cyprideis torosa]